MLGNKDMPSWIRRMVSNTMDTAERLAHTPDAEAVVRISDKGRVLLGKIRQAVVSQENVSAQSYIGAEEGAGHASYEGTQNTDIATILSTLDIADPENYFAPLEGGEEFLEHVLGCRSCLAKMALLRQSEGMDGELSRVIAKSLEAEARQRGINVRSGDARTLKDSINLPKAN